VKPAAKKSAAPSAAQRAIIAKRAALAKAKAAAAAKAQKLRDDRARAAAKAKAAASAKAQKERDAKAKADLKAKAAAAKAKAVAAAKAQRERDLKAKAAAKEREVQLKARDKAAAEAKKQREIDAKRKAIEAEKQRKLREIERRNQEELKRQERRDAEERRRLEALERKMLSKPYGKDEAFLNELRALLLETREATNAQIGVAEAEAEEMLVDRERLEYDDEDGSSVASDIQRDQLKDFATALRLKVDEIDVALSRVDDGSYGRCDECYEPISKARLLAQLPVFTCVSCRASV
jgi:RNA polymerase-binding transcription factor DksA